MFKENIETITSQLENLVSTKTMVGSPSSAAMLRSYPSCPLVLGLGPESAKAVKNQVRITAKGPAGVAEPRSIQLPWW